MKEAKERKKHAGGPIAEREFAKWIEKAKEKFLDRFDYSKVSSVGFHYKAEINVKCMRHDHGEFVISAKNFMRSKEPCVECCKLSKPAIAMSTQSLLDREENWLQLSKAAHVDKMGRPKYDYSDSVFLTMKSIVKVCCLSHGNFEVKASSHAHDKKGCPRCLEERKQAEFVKAANEAHAEFYDYSETKYEKADGDVQIRCPIHGLFQQNARNHTRGHGCTLCHRAACTMTTKDFIEAAVNVHGPAYDYSRVKYIRGDLPVEIVCPVHEEFNQRARNHLDGQGCPTCGHWNSAAYFREWRKAGQDIEKSPRFFSHSAIQWLESMAKVDGHIQHAANLGEFAVPGTKYRADGYRKETRTIYEYHGSFWHGDPTVYEASDIHPVSGKTMGELYAHTCHRTKTLREKNYTVIEQWESDWFGWDQEKRQEQRVKLIRFGESTRSGPEAALLQDWLVSEGLEKKTE